MNRISKLAIAGMLLLSAVTSWAGTQDTKAAVEQPENPAIPPWQITVGGPGWLAWVSGHTGFHGVNPYVSVGPGQIVRHVDFLWATQAEVRKGKYGIFGGFIYVNGQAGVNGSGLVSRIGVGSQTFIGQTFLSYRIIDSPRGWLDLLGGFRFTYVGSQADLNPNVPAIDAASTQLVNDFAGAVDARLVARLQSDFSGLASDVKTFIQDTVLDRLKSIEGSIPSLPVPPVAAGAVDTIRNHLQDLLDADARDLAAAIRASATARVNQLKTQISRQVATFVTGQLNRGYSFYDSWADPVIGLRGRLNLSKAFYLISEADVGGFGIGSDIAVGAYGALGCQITRNLFSEVGFRYLYEDFRDESVGYLYQISFYGPQITVGLRF
ncbi:MAG: hypothetical protein JO025_20320 [Verrucomicrobia bacterium]|nr:hypothetical protein [Verrucomicrobiota bacterium]